MSHFCSAHRTPPVGVDPVDDAEVAMAVVELAMTHPLVAETIVLVLDAERRGRTVVVVDGTDDPDAIVEVVERLAEASAVSGEPGTLVVASVRPDDDGRPLPDDADRWLEASDVADEVGVELVEWFVVGPMRTWCPRDLIAEPPRWGR